MLEIILVGLFCATIGFLAGFAYGSLRTLQLAVDILERAKK